MNRSRGAGKFGTENQSPRPGYSGRSVARRVARAEGGSRVIVPISEHRLKRVFADIQTENLVAGGAGKGTVIGQIISELIGIRTAPIGKVVMDASGSLWLERASFDSSNSPMPIPDSYLARSIKSFLDVAELNCVAGKLSTLPRGQQWRYIKAEAGFRDWERLNDPMCLDDPGAYWNEVRSDAY